MQGNRTGICFGKSEYVLTTSLTVLCVGIGLLEMMLVGCATSPAVYPCPLSYEEQSRSILEIVPIGTPRAEVLKKLAVAEIQGSEGISDSIYYINLWDGQTGGTWMMNVALLFDQDGRLYKTKPARSETQIERSGVTGLPSSNDSRAMSSDDRVEFSKSGVSLFPPHREASSTDLSPSRRGERTPFGTTATE